MLIKAVRMPQSKAIHCYLLMTAWIFLIIIGVYKFLEPQQKILEPIQESRDGLSTLAVDVKTKRIFKICNFPDDINKGDEGIYSDKWHLKGLLILIRHGDRGPLQHVKRISSINCGVEDTDLLTTYKAYLLNETLSGKVLWAGPGPFHGFSYLPTHPTECQLGQLTIQGITQLLKLGAILKASYVDIWPKLLHLTPQDVLVYSTRYRRTFQSALALLFGFIPPETLSKITFYESQSMSFCFRDCGCPITDKLFKNVKHKISQQLHSHPAIEELTSSTGKRLFSMTAEHEPFSGDPHSVRDALLAFVCHRHNLPCDTLKTRDGTITTSCVRRQNVVGIFAYTDWVNYQKWRNVNWRRFCLLKSYGLIRHIVQQMLYMLSNGNEGGEGSGSENAGGGGPRVVLFSGHDHTLEQLASALGLHHDPRLLRYAGRMVFEIYQQRRTQKGQTSAHGLSNAAEGVYFRILTNGRDVTKQVAFCRNLIKIPTTTNTADIDRNPSSSKQIYLCKMEDIVRFLHDDYFAPLNVTNFKDACISKNI